MKTPMQELYDILCEYREQEESPLVISRLNSLSAEALRLIDKESDSLDEKYQQGWDNALYEVERWTAKNKEKQ